MNIVYVFILVSINFNLCCARCQKIKFLIFSQFLNNRIKNIIETQMWNVHAHNHYWRLMRSIINKQITINDGQGFTIMLDSAQIDLCTYVAWGDQLS